MSDAEKFIELLDEIDAVLESYNPGELHPDQIIKEIFAQRAEQRPVLERVIALCNSGLEQYPFNT